MGARSKLNGAYLNGALLIAAVAGVMTGSWMIFGSALGLLLVSNVISGEIRLSGRR